MKHATEVIVVLLIALWALHNFIAAQNHRRRPPLT